MFASFAGEFVDLRGVSPRPVCLSPDEEEGYPAGNALADATRAAGHNGIIYPSVRYPGGTCLVALWPQAVQSVAQGRVLALRWTGSNLPELMVRRNSTWLLIRKGSTTYCYTIFNSILALRVLICPNEVSFAPLEGILAGRRRASARRACVTGARRV
jgi:hypothetical protein